MQEHEYKARDKTVQKMSRDGLREENLRNKEEKRITGRDTDTEISRSEKKEELDFSKRRHERLKEEREMEQPEQSSRKPRYSREHADILDDEQDIATDADVEEGLTDDSSENPKIFPLKMEKIPNLPFAQRVSVDSQEGNGHIWRQLQTAGIFGRKRWSGIMLQRKEGRKRRLPEKKKQPKENLPVTGKLPK